ncbi:MAG: hypothetical protein RI957_1350 [Verrucomicrobiota bacterium]|jgi:uncharacterized protein YoaH (UPF0181 family)
MKSSSFFVTIPLAASLALVSCKKNQPATPVTAPQATEPSNPDIAAETPAIPPPSVKPADRASKLGFAQMLPKDTETLLLIQNGAEVAKRFKGSKFYSFLKSQNPGIDAMVEGEGAEGLAAMDFLGQEFFLATGKNTGEQSANLVRFSNRQNYFQFRNLLTMVISSLKEEEPDLEMLSEEGPLFDMVKDPQSGLGLLKKSESPPIYLGCKTAPEDREKVLQAFKGMTANLALAGASAEEVNFELDGRSFAGHQIAGKKLVEDLQADQALIERMDEKLEKDVQAELWKVLAEKNIIAVTGMVNDYVVLFVGSRKEDLTFAATPAESFAASEALSFVDPYLEKSPVAVAYSDKSVLDGLSSGHGIAVIAQALRDAIAGNGKVDTREIEALLDVIAEREKELTSMTKFSTFGAVAMLDEGFKIETFGGSNSPNIQMEGKNQMGALETQKDTAVFVNWTGNAAYGVKANAYLESLVETTYAITKNVSTWDVKENPGFDAFKQYFTLFEENFSDDTVKLWQAMSVDMSDGLGNESAIVVDLNGEMPPLPNVPQELVKAGKFPRVSWVKPVKDRAKLAAAWDQMNASGESIMKQVSAMMESEQALPKPMSSKENGLITWFFAGPLFTDDFAPSVTLDDKWFVASTSKTHAVGLAQAAATSTSGKTGAYMSVKFDALRACAEHWLKAVDQNKEAIFEGNESAAEDFTTNQKMIKDSLNALGELDNMTLHTRKESGTDRSSFHLKTR